MPRLVLASGSPRRRALLEELGLRFDVLVSQVDEHVDPDEPIPSIRRLAEHKAESVARQVPGEAFVIGADTIGLHRGQVLGKPRDPADAVQMLGRLSGDTHQVVTGVAALHVHGGEVLDRLTDHSSTEVRFHPLPAATIEAYVATGEPLDKAGGYAIQGQAAAFVASIHGSYHNVVGLPLDITLACLHELGHHLPEHLIVPLDATARGTP